MKQPSSASDMDLLTKILEGLRAIDKDILNGTPLKAALTNACRLVAEVFGLKLCWVGLCQEGSPEVAPVASWGFEEGYLSSIRVTCDDSEHGRGPTGTAIRTRKPVVCNDTHSDPAYSPWREEARKRGYRSSAAIPMAYNGEVMGALNVYAAEPDHFDLERVELIGAFANQVAVLVRATQQLEALRESEVRYRGLVEAAKEAVISMDEEGKIVLWNPAAERIFGYTAEEALGKDYCTFIVPEEYRRRCRQAFEKAMEGELEDVVNHAIEAVGLRKDGTTFPTEHSISVERMDKGMEFTAVLRDVSERKRAEETVKAERQRLTDVLEMLPVYVVLLKPDYHIPFANRFFRERFGESHGRRCFEYLFNRTEPCENCETYKVLKTRSPHRWEWTGPDGRNYDIYDFPFTDTDGSHLVMEMGIDITEQKLAKEALLESERKFKDLAEKSLVGVYLVQDGIYRYVNPKLAEIYGYEVEELIDKKGPVDLTLAEDRPIAEGNIQRQISGEIESVCYEARGLRKGGETIHVETLGTRTTYQGRPAIIGTMVDITEKKAEEEELKRRLMKFRLEDGKLYLVKEPLPTLAIEAFKELLKVGYHGLILSRATEEEFRRAIDDGFEFLWISELGGEKAIPPVPKELEERMWDLPSRSAVLLDRLDYLISKNGFKNTLSFMQRLREHAYLTGHIVISPIDPSTLGRQELRLLEKEAAEVEPLLKAKLSDALLEILRFVYEAEASGIKPSLTDIGSVLGVSKPTVRKRVRQLISAGYMKEEVSGRRKVAGLLEKGRRLF